MPAIQLPRARGRPSAAEAARAALADGVARLHANDPGVRARDPEAVHQMRVAVRRIRSDLRTLRPLLHRPWVQELSNALRPMAASLGAVRDLDVLLARLEAGSADLAVDLAPLTRDLRELRDAAHAALVESLASTEHAALIDRVTAASREPPLVPLAHGAASEVLPPLVTTAWRRLARRADRLARALARDPLGPPDVELHRVRILAKRARYAAEAAGRALGRRQGRAAQRFATRLAGLQQLLGEHQDAVGAIRELSYAVTTHPNDARLAFAAGRLLERQEAGVTRARGTFPAAWAEARRPRYRRWLDR